MPISFRWVKSTVERNATSYATKCMLVMARTTAWRKLPFSGHGFRWNLCRMAAASEDWMFYLCFHLNVICKTIGRDVDWTSSNQSSAVAVCTHCVDSGDGLDSSPLYSVWERDFYPGCRIIAIYIHKLTRIKNHYVLFVQMIYFEILHEILNMLKEK